MKDLNYKEIYGLKGLEEMLSSVLEKGVEEQEKAFNQNMNIKGNFGKYKIRKNNEFDEIRFSNDNYLETSYDSLNIIDFEESQTKLFFQNDFETQERGL